MLSSLKQEVLEANLELKENNLVLFTWGNVSGICRERGLIVIKPSGVDYSHMKLEDMVVVDLDGKVVEGKLKPSSDTPTHLELYHSFSSIGGVVHTHSNWATIWAQAGKSIPAFGTTHADTFFGEIPCSRRLNKNEIENNYEKNTGIVIAEKFINRDYLSVPGILVNEHGPFCWGITPHEAVHNAVVMEQVAKMAFYTKMLGKTSPIDENLLNKHFKRKHGDDPYYGQ